MSPARFRYSPWDGTQVGFELDAEGVFEAVTDDLLYHGDINNALRRLMQQGFRDRAGRDVQGLRELMERVRLEREQRLAHHDLGGVFREIAEELEAVVDTERAELDALEAAATDSGDQRRAELTSATTSERRLELDLMPSDLAGRTRSLEQYDFVSNAARERFEALMERLREQVMDQYLNRMAGAVESLTPEDRARMTDMLAELNAMLAARARGEEPDFDGFMERYGDFFPEQPRSLDELLEVMARRMAAAQAMLNSMTPAQREQLRRLSEQLLDDLDLRWQVDQLGEALQGLFPDAGWQQSYEFSGSDPLGFAEAAQMMSELGDLDALERMLSSASTPAQLAEVDLDRVRDLLGEESAASLERLAELTRMLSESGLIEQREGRLELTPRGLQRLGRNALAELFRKLDEDRFGRHEVDRRGAGHERAYSSKPYEWGDPFNLDIGRTLRNAVVRGASPTTDRSVRLAPDDFEIEETEHTVRSSTVLMLDLSLSMPMRENFLPAKKVAMALHSLISTQFPRDYLGIVGFSSVARELPARELPEVSWDFVYGTNMQHGFLLARRLLARQTGTKQIIMITDGEPTAHINAAGEPEFHYPPVRETVEATLLEVARCTKERIRINTFMLDADRGLQRFVERMTEMNRGRAFFTTPETLGDFVLVDFLEQRRAMVRGRRTA